MGISTWVLYVESVEITEKIELSIDFKVKILLTQSY